MLKWIQASMGQIWLSSLCGAQRLVSMCVHGGVLQCMERENTYARCREHEIDDVMSRPLPVELSSSSELNAAVAGAHCSIVCLAQQGYLQSPSGCTGALEGFHGVLAALLSAWEAIKAAEAQRAQQETELFKNKTQTSTFQTEEVRWPLRYG